MEEKVLCRRGAVQAACVVTLNACCVNDKQPNSRSPEVLARQTHGVVCVDVREQLDLCGRVLLREAVCAYPFPKVRLKVAVKGRHFAGLLRRIRIL